MSIGSAHVDAAADGVLPGFKKIRETAEAYMDKRDLAGDGWSEEAVTAIAVTEGRPHVDVVEFNRNQEGRGPNALGADYLWWWIDSQTGECFGMLVQAKRLKRGSKGWLVDVSHREGKQLGDLLRTAENLDVPAVYAVYTGGLVFREPLPCPHNGAQAGPDPSSADDPGPEEECLPCRKMAISMVTAYQLNTGWYDPKMTADLVVSESVPVEDLVDPDVPSPPVWDLNLHELTDPQLRDFLLKPQGGAREIARRIFRLVADHRRGAFSAASAELLPVPGAPIFPDVPEDRGHFPGPYYRHVMQGLRTSPPDYVETLRRPPIFDEFPQVPDGNIGFIVAAGGPPAGRRPPPELQDTNVAGVVLITL
jgi:hypothetical protein